MCGVYERSQRWCSGCSAFKPTSFGGEKCLTFGPPCFLHSPCLKMPGRSIKVKTCWVLGHVMRSQLSPVPPSSTSVPTQQIKTRSSQLHSEVVWTNGSAPGRGPAVAVSPWPDYWTIHRVSVGDYGESQLCIITHRIHGAGIYALTLGVYWW